ncbi:MarR family winged helix-turn-helix transcriptional regulator [Vibrio aestuarianus]|uniref:MarR family transcriptional regulator n=1 Tax=Vibrio aestuarianus TaxID=28171 RepID=A0A9X4FF26_9VIBR|nr:MarR family transcriptional regulator [Vibrio aestuarianus]MDE1234980.1 MarR family transcriptional regulator [Vibrio aestuarianus]MDE1245889.1 MarR family transcriptional regulator [Vibrio aestuarianus]MDE1347287.1 MarR family transcriptional regulator [Vibrio aestuarianus]MDE1349348.1 MarR family transcriptional regulator [Vibrio aestuarianus]NGZ63208.1 MarR family transcriptional regulator [Vibrio aestuarianus subsp. cardii]
MDKNIEMRDAVWQLMRTFKYSMKHAVKTGKLEISPVHVRILHTIELIDNCTANDVSMELQVDKAQIARIVKELLDQEWIVRAPHPTDGRSRILQLTSSGKTLIEKVHKIEGEVFQVMTQCVSAEEAAVFMNVVKKMSKSLMMTK